MGSGLTYKLLKDITKKIGSGATPRGGKEAYKDSGISLIRSQNVLDFKFEYDGLAFIDEKQAEKLSNVIVEENDILLNITGDSVARCSIVPSQILPARVNQHVMIIKVNENSANYKYVFYYLQYLKRHLLQLASGGATRNALTKTMVENLELNLVSLTEQKVIANILSSLDNKIDSNNAIIANLEDQTQVIFKSWFVDFKPFQGNEFKESELGRIPELFAIKTLKEISTRRNGYTYKSAELDQDSNMNMITLKNFNRNGGINYSYSKPIIETERMKEFHYLNNEDILIACTDLTQNAEVLGRTISYFRNEEYNKEIYSMDLVKVEPNDVNDQTYIYYYLNSAIFKSFAEGVATGTTVLHLPKRSIDDFKMLYPTSKVVKEFSNIVKPMLLKQNQLILQNKKLKEIRDTLLPKLMSGEIRVEEAVEIE